MYHCLFPGILQGVSQLLLVFDQAEVRKIIKNCENIIEYLKVRLYISSLVDTDYDSSVIKLHSN